MTIPVHDLCMAAGVHFTTWHAALSGEHKPRRATLQRLETALKRLKLTFARSPDTLRDAAAWRCALVLAAAYAKTADPRDVLRSDPSRKATADPQWLAEAQVRRLAYWIANGMLGLRTTAIGRVAGVSKQAVSIGIQEVEDDKAFAPILDELERVFS